MRHCIVRKYTFSCTIEAETEEGDRFPQTMKTKLKYVSNKK